MTAWRMLAGGVAVLAAVQMGQAQTYQLAENLKVGDCFRFQINMTLAGDMRVTKVDKPASLKLEAGATLEFPERILAVAANGLPQKTARAYETAKATITLAGGRSERTLRPERKLIVAQRAKDQAQVYCPNGPLTREELELTGEHLDTLALTGLLPGKAVAIGDSWKVSTEIIQALCNFEAMTAQDTQDLSCKLEEVKDNVARVSLAGSVVGIDVGVLAQVKIEGSYRFDLTSHRLVSLEWKEKDERNQGPASPATTVESTTVLTRTPMEVPSTLGEAALVPVVDGMDVPGEKTQLAYRDPKGHFDLVYAREWHIVAQTDEHLVMRLMDHGELIAQVTITPWTNARPGEHLTPEAFQSAMASTPGWEQEQELQSGEVPTPSDQPGRWTYRLSVVGKMDNMKLLQNFYLVAGPAGDQVVLAFTMTQAQAEKLGTRDLALVGSLDFPTKK